MQELLKTLIIERRAELNYIINLPNEYANSLKKKYPIILFLHGSGERGNKIEDIKKYGIHRYLDRKNIPAIIVSPQCAANSFWDKYIDEIEVMINEVSNEFRVDKNRIYLIGISLGAYAAWNFGMQKPYLFSAIVPIAGGAMLPKFASSMKDIPVWTFHGDKDNEVLVEESIKAVNQLKKFGGDVRLTIVEGAGHELCITVFEREDLFEWLFKQEKEIDYLK